MGLWNDIKERRVTQIFFTYLVGGWLVLQVVDQVVDRDVLPGWVYWSALIVFAFGIPAALIIGWFHGERGDQKAPPLEIGLLTLLGVGAALAVSMVVRQALSLEELQAGSVDLRNTAVLYFDGVGEDASAVAQGITEDLIGRLSRVNELDVVSRNGSRQVAAEELLPAEAAEALDVGSVLTGAVERFGDRYQVDVRVRDRSGTPIGAPISVEAPAGDLLALEERVATEVEDAFRAALGEEIRLRKNRAEAPNDGAWLAVARGERAISEATAGAGRGNAAAAMDALQRAEEQFEEASRAAPAWGHPWALRAQVAYEEGYLAEDLETLQRALARTRLMAGEALSRDGTSALGHYLRGTALYQSVIFGFEEDEESALRAVEEDLETARTLDADMAEVPATLSHYYYQIGDLNSAALAAREAYTQDAFLQSADGVLVRLFDTNYDLENARQAEEWCQEGSRRFPRDPAFVECQLVVMTMPGVEPDVDRAWELRDSVVAMVPVQRAYYQSFGSIMVGGVLARAALSDSASVVLDRARLDAAVAEEADPSGELLSVEAAMRLMNGEERESLNLLQGYSAANPGHFGEGGRLAWWWRPLQGNPEFERIRRLN